MKEKFVKNGIVQVSMIGNTSPGKECQGEGEDSHREYYLTLTFSL